MLVMTAGLRIDGSPATDGADYDGPAVERNLPMSTSLLWVMMSIKRA